MSQQTEIILDLKEFEEFREIANKFNVKFDVKHKNNNYIITAPLEYISKWGYLEEPED
jgi:hypothetical protein